MPKRIVIAGAGGFGDGVYSWLAQSPRHREEMNIRDVVFIDDNFCRASTKREVVGTLRDYTPTKEDKVVVAVGNPEVRRDITQDLGARGAKFHSFVDDRAIVAEGVEIGQGAVICPGTVISADASVGAHVHINFNCAVGHDAVLGEFTTLSPMVNIMGGTSVGSGVFVGGSATVLPRIEIGSDAVIGAGATVVKPVGKGRTVMGTPAAVGETSF